MDEAKILVLDFRTENDESYKLNIANPKTDLTRTEVLDEMQNILDSTAVLSSGGVPLSGINGAYYKITQIVQLVDPGGGE